MSNFLLYVIGVCIGVVGVYLVGYLFSKGYHKAKREFVDSIVPLVDEKESDNGKR